MSVMDIEFDAEKLIHKLNIIEKSQLPFAATQALKVFGFKIANEILPEEFSEAFNAPDGTGKPVPRTLRAIGYKVDNQTLTLKVNDKKDKGLSPKEYLYSALLGGQVTPTAFSAGVRAITEKYPIPAHGNLRALGQYNVYGDIKSSYAATVLSGLRKKGTTSRGERFVATGGSDSGAMKANRIYRVKGDRFIPIATLVDSPTRLDPAIPYRSFVKKQAERLLPSILTKQLEKAMASR